MKKELLSQLWQKVAQVQQWDVSKTLAMWELERVIVLGYAHLSVHQHFTLDVHWEHNVSHLSSLSHSIDHLSIKEWFSKYMLWAKHASYISACSFKGGMEKWVVCLPSHMSRDYTMKQEPSALPRGLVSQWYMQRGWNRCPGVSVGPRFLHSSVLMEAQMVKSDHVGTVGA